MRRPRLTDKVLDGLATISELTRCWREADEGTGCDTLTAAEQDAADAAAEWIDNSRRWKAEKAEGKE